MKSKSNSKVPQIERTCELGLLEESQSNSSLKNDEIVKQASQNNLKKESPRAHKNDLPPMPIIKKPPKVRPQKFDNHQSEYSNFVADQQRARKLRLARMQGLDLDDDESLIGFVDKKEVGLDDLLKE